MKKPAKAVPGKQQPAAAALVREADTAAFRTLAGRASAQAVVFNGVRRCGKSSLLEKTPP